MISIFTILFSCHIIHIAGQECEALIAEDGDLIYKGLKDGCEEIKGYIIISNLLPTPYHKEEVF